MRNGNTCFLAALFDFEYGRTYPYAQAQLNKKSIISQLYTLPFIILFSRGALVGTNSPIIVEFRIKL